MKGKEKYHAGAEQRIYKNIGNKYLRQWTLIFCCHILAFPKILKAKDTRAYTINVFMNSKPKSILRNL